MWVLPLHAGSGNKIVGFAARGGLNLVKMIPAAIGTPMCANASGELQRAPGFGEEFGFCEFVECEDYGVHFVW